MRSPNAYCRDAPQKPMIIFNGDTFDLLRVEPESNPDDGHERRVAGYLTPTTAARTLEKLLDGHAHTPIPLIRITHDIE